MSLYSCFARSETLSENASFLICDCTWKDKRYSCAVNVLAPGGEHPRAIVVQMPVSCGKLHGERVSHDTPQWTAVDSNRIFSVQWGLRTSAPQQAKVGKNCCAYIEDELFVPLNTFDPSWLSTRHAFHCTLWWKKSQSSGWQQECRHSHIYNYNSPKCHNKIWIKYDEMIKWYTWSSDPHGDYPRISKLTSACLEHALHGLANSECQRHVQLNNKLMCLFTKSNLKILSQVSFVLHGSITK